MKSFYFQVKRNISMEALFNSLSKLNDPNAANVLEKACLYRSDPHSAKIKPEYEEFYLFEKIVWPFFFFRVTNFLVLHFFSFFYTFFSRFILVEKKIAADKLPDKLDANKNGEDQANDSASGADSAEPVSKKQRTVKYCQVYFFTFLFESIKFEA